MASSSTLTRASGNITTAVPTWNQNTSGSAAKVNFNRTIWGQNFDGSGNVSGSINNVISYNCRNIQYIR